jgi:outer membrane receptor for ferrienterochelin and colicins
MKKIKLMMLLLFSFATASIYSQSNKLPQADTTVTFKVFGACEQCKDRIENAVKMKGVSSGIWDVDSKMMTLVYNSSKVTLQKIQNRIVAVGHDIDEKKANVSVYNALPDCCHYREMDNMPDEAVMDTTQKINAAADSIMADHKEAAVTNAHVIKGVVLESNKKGEFKPLAGASVVWLNSGIGTATDSSGIFSIKHSGTESRLVISYTGYKPDTIAITSMTELKIILAAGKQLNEVLITSKQRSTYLSALSPLRTQIMTEKELFKAACCNLSESFETNPSVDVSYNDAVTGSKQIQLLGLSGNYTQLTVENLPGPRGLATPLGLNSIAGPWIESIQLTKGTGSVANGYESIAGQINVELKKPEKSEQLFFNAYVNDFGKTDLNLNLSKKIGTKWSTALLLHDDFINNATVDFNKDGFRDLPTGNQLSLVNRWKYDDGKGFLTQFGIKVLNDKKTGGEVDYNADTDKYSTHHYGLGINTERYEAFAKIGYVFPEKKYKSVGLQLAAIDHRQDSYFGTTHYDGKQQNFYSNLIYQSIINNTNHKFRTGVSFLYDKYNENFNAINYQRKEVVPGAFFEYTYDYLTKLSVVAGIRTDHNNLFGWFVTPRINIKYEPVKGTIIHLSGGRGQRTANIFAENTSVFVSARQVNILGASAGKAYGLDAEVAWNKGISVDQKFKLFSNDAMFSVDFYRNDFRNQVITDIENVREVNFYNLKGKSYSNSFQAELSVEPIKKLDVRIAYRYFDVKATFGDKLLQRPFIASNRAFANVAYAINGWKFDYTISYNGKKRIPGTTDNPVQYQRSEYSPDYMVIGAQVTKSIGKTNPIDFYVGAENIGNYFQRDVIVAADQPFSPYFDASLVWGPVSGRMFYAGLRFKIK